MARGTRWREGTTMGAGGCRVGQGGREQRGGEELGLGDGTVLGWAGGNGHRLSWALDKQAQTARLPGPDAGEVVFTLGTSAAPSQATARKRGDTPAPW